MFSLQFAMIHIKSAWLNPDSQYRWFLVLYQIGEFASRSFGTLLKPRRTWWAPIMQTAIACFFLYMATSLSASNPWVVFAFVLGLGIVGGLCYVHTFHRVVKELPAHQHKFSLGILAVAETFGTAIGALISIPIHAILCGEHFTSQ